MNKCRLCVIFLLFLCLVVRGQGPDETCVRCLCHARSGCFFLRNCARYSISKDYWTTAGRPVVADDDPNRDEAYTNCMQNENCIIRSVQGYVQAASIQDCNCDGQIDCKDYAAIHLRGGSCRSAFEPNQLRRLDNCLQSRLTNPPPTGWNMACDREPFAV